MARGFFISLEGGEGSGKTTQINRLVDMLSERGYDVVITREPGGTAEAESIRNLLVQRDGGDWNAMAEVLLLFAARSMHIEKLIKPALNDGKIVICDRFTDSTFAYQGFGRGLELNKIKEIERISINEFKPDLTFILDIDVRTGLNRSNARLSEGDTGEQTEDRFERLDIDFHERLREGFLEIARQNEGRCYILNAAQSMDHLSDEIKNIALAKLQGE
ncbi:MAG: dTMP kinase [Zetaproteobacteria bacterium]|nr:MAG: dTMP kinase [Zetaproteobacteria bacterium]